MRSELPRGMTLLEIMISTAIMVGVVAVVSALFVHGGRLTRDAEETTESNEAARSAGDAVADALRLAGMGASAGLQVGVAGARIATNSIIGLNNVGDAGMDELWVVRPNANALGTSCDGTNAGDLGAAATLHSTSAGLQIRCDDGLADAGSLLMVTDLTHAALLSVSGFSAASGTGRLIGFNESTIANFSNVPTRGSFQVGDVVYPITIQHYYVDTDSFGRKSLMVSMGNLATVAGGLPFRDTGSPRVVESNIEDFQLVFGVDPTASDDPTQIVWQNGFGSASAGAYVPGLRSVRVNIVSLSRRAYLNDQQQVRYNSNLAPHTVEDHVPSSTVSDGRRRAFYTRRVELPNIAPANL